MRRGCLIAVVGPSGVGKDSVMMGIKAACPEVHLVKRVITRAPELGGEDYTAVTVPEFKRHAELGEFAVHWGAHDLFYAIPQSVKARLAEGQTCLANFSRSALLRGADAFDDFKVLNITASRGVLANRLHARGRETEAQIEKRLKQADKPLPEGLDVVHLANEAQLDATVLQALALLKLEKVSQ